MDRKKCFKFQQQIVDNLRVTSDDNSLVVFWNKYQILLLDEKELDNHGYLTNCRFVYNTDFEIHQLIISKHLFCLDFKGNLFAYALTPQNASSQKRLKHDFQNLGHNIICIQEYEDLLFSVKLVMDKLVISIDKVKLIENLLNLRKYSENKIENINMLTSNKIKRENCLLCCHIVDKSHFEMNNPVLKGKRKLQCPQFIIVMTFDKLTLYAVLVDLEFNENILTPFELFTCPSEINSIILLNENFLNLIVSLSSGTIIKIPMNKNLSPQSTTHLNTAIHKCSMLNNKFIYTDGTTMWESTNSFSESDFKLKQLFVKNVKDFTQIANTGRIITTTYLKLVYSFHLNDESSYLAPATEEEYYSAKHLLNNMDYMHKIIKEVEKNDEIINNIKKEENYITTLALSNRQDIMQEIIQYKVNVHENYEDILKEGLILNLSNNLHDYFVKDSFFLLIKLSLTKHQNFHDILENIFIDSKIHLTILSDQKTIKTICIKAVDELANLNTVIPLIMKKCNVTDIYLDIKIAKKIPMVFNSKQNLWTTFYYKQIILTPEHFIRTNHCLHKVNILKDPVDSIETLLYKTAHKYHGHLFRIIKASEDLFTWSFYIRLSNTYMEFLHKNNSFYCDYFNSTKAKFFLKEISSEKFINYGNSISFSVANEKINIQIINDKISNSFSKNMMKVSSVNPILALGIRNFFSSLIHNNYISYQPRQKLLDIIKINSSLQKIEEAVKKCIDEREPFERFFDLFEKYQISLCETLV